MAHLGNYKLVYPVLDDAVTLFLGVIFLLLGESKEVR